MALGAVALDTARGAGVTGMIVALGSLVDREGILAVGACRDRARRVVDHPCNDTAVWGSSYSVIPTSGLKATPRRGGLRRSSELRAICGVSQVALEHGGCHTSVARTGTTSCGRAPSMQSRNDGFAF